jgi:hypothetical protein
LICPFGAEPFPLLHFPRRRSPTSIIVAQRLGSSVESQDPGIRPLLDGAAKRANRRSTRLPHGLNKTDDVLELDGPVSRDGSTGGGSGGAARVVEVGEDGGEGSV